jgi:hypothetical protein
VRLVALSRSEYVFSKPNGLPYKSMDKLFTRACEDAGLTGTGLSLHSLRHTFASRLVMSGGGSAHDTGPGRLARSQLDAALRAPGPWPSHAGIRADRRRISQQDSQQPNFCPCGVACGTPGKYVIMQSLLAYGEVREWPNRAVSKTAVLATGPWVRSPPSPPIFKKLCIRVRVMRGRCLLKCHRQCNLFNTVSPQTPHTPCNRMQTVLRAIPRFLCGFRRLYAGIGSPPNLTLVGLESRPRSWSSPLQACASCPERSQPAG